MIRVTRSRLTISCAEKNTRDAVLHMLSVGNVPIPSKFYKSAKNSDFCAADTRIAAEWGTPPSYVLCVVTPMNRLLLQKAQKYEAKKKHGVLKSLEYSRDTLQPIRRKLGFPARLG